MTGTEPFRFEDPAFRRDLEDHPHEAGEVAFLESILRPGDTVVEAGGNRGITAVAASRKIGETGRLFVFEPVPEYFEALERNLALNGVSNAELFQAALTDRAGSTPFYKHGGGSGIAPAEDAEKIDVETLGLEDLMERRGPLTIDVLNMDCEGAELLVFRGAEAVLREQGPQVFCEMHPSYLQRLGQSVEDVVACLEGVGYEVKPLDVERLDQAVGLGDCSHVYARKRAPSGEVEALRKRIEDLKARMPAHSTPPSMMIELEELEEELEALENANGKG